MKKYIQTIKITISSFLQFRSSLLLSLIGQAIFYIAIILLWLTIYQGREMVGQYSQKEMITYIIVSGILSIYIYFSHIRYIIDTWITKGYLSYWITKPMSVLKYLFINDITRRIVNFSLSFVPFCLVALLFYQYIILPRNFTYFLLFIVVFILAGIITYFIYQGVVILAFWVEKTRGITHFVNLLISIAGGSLLPLSLFPGIVSKIFLALPFKYIFYVPMQVYLGKINYQEIYLTIIKEIIWIIAFYIVTKLVWKRGLKDYTAMGG